MGMGPVCQTSLPTGSSEWGLGYISHAWNSSLRPTCSHLVHANSPLSTLQAKKKFFSELKYFVKKVVTTCAIFKNPSIPPLLSHSTHVY